MAFGLHDGVITATEDDYDLDYDLDYDYLGPDRGFRQKIRAKD